MVFLYNYKKRNPVYIEKWVVKYTYCFICRALTPTRGCLCDDCYFKRLKAIECHD